MTKGQAMALQAKWNEQANPLPCEHLNQEMESTAGGYLTGTYYCVVCGETVAHPHRD